MGQFSPARKTLKKIGGEETGPKRAFFSPRAGSVFTIDTFDLSLLHLLNWELNSFALIFGGKVTLFRCLKLFFLRAKGRGKYDDGF